MANLPAVYYPSVACRLTLRFDEALLSGANDEVPTFSPQEKVRAQSFLLGDIAGRPGGLDEPGSAPSQREGLMNGTKDRLSHVMSIVPKSATFELPTFRQAPKFSATFAFRDFPVDPRAIRAIGIEFYVGTVQASQFADGLQGRTLDNGRLASQVTMEPANLMLAGLVDNMSTSYTEKASEVTLDGRGLQGILLDKKVSAETLQGLNFDQRIDQVVEDLLHRMPQGDKIEVLVKASEWPGGVVPRLTGLGELTRTNKGADGTKPQSSVDADPNAMGVWDVITKYCFLVAGLPYFIGHKLWIRPSRSIFEQKNVGFEGDTPFKDGLPREIKAGQQTVQAKFRKMVYGRNLQTFKLERKFGGVTVPTVRVVAVDTSSAARGQDRLLTVEYPEKGDKARTTRVDPSGNEKATDFLNVPVKGINDKVRLLAIAKQVYEEVGRGELGGSASTKDLASLGGDNGDTDLLRLRPGDAMEFLVDSAGLQGIPPVASELNRQAAESDQKLTDSISARLGLSNDLAKVLVGTARGRFQGLQNVFRVTNARYTWDVSQGIAVDFSFQNFITARSDVERSGTVDPAAAGTSTGAA